MKRYSRKYGIKLWICTIERMIGFFFSIIAWFDKNLRSTLVYLINVLHNLLFSWKKSSLHTLIPSCTFINFWKFPSKLDLFTIELWKIPTCTALLHPARSLILDKFPACVFITSCTFIRYSRVKYLLTSMKM